MPNKPKMWPTSETRILMPGATEDQKAALTTTRGKQAAQITDPDEKKAYIKDSAGVDKDYDATAQATSVKGNELQKRAVMGSMKKGGMVPKTGPYKLHKGEKVIPKDKVKEMANKMEKATEGLGGSPDKKMRVKKTVHMTIEPTDNKGFIVKHEEHHDGVPSGKRKHHVFSKTSDMYKHVMKTYPAPAAEATPDQAAPAPDASAAPSTAPAAVPSTAAAPPTV